MDAKLRTLVDGGRAIVNDEWLDRQSQTDYGSEIRTAYNRNRVGVLDQYVAWIADSARPVDLEFRENMTAVASL
jgi:hypothetical protein